MIIANRMGKRVRFFHYFEVCGGTEQQGIGGKRTALPTVGAVDQPQVRQVPGRPFEAAHFQHTHLKP